MHGSPSFRLWAGIVIAFASHGAFAATTLTMTTCLLYTSDAADE